MDHRGDDATPSVLGVILLVGVVASLAGVVGLLAGQFSEEKEPEADKIGFLTYPDLGKLLVAKGPPPEEARTWEQYTVTGCTTVPTGLVRGGQELTGCVGVVSIIDDNADKTVYIQDFGP